MVSDYADDDNDNDNVMLFPTTAHAVMVSNFQFLLTAMGHHHGLVVYPSQVAPETYWWFLPQLDGCPVPSASRLPLGLRVADE